MALSVNTSYASPLGTTLIIETASTASSNNNVTGAAATIRVIEVYNGSNATSYTKVWSGATPTVGTDAPVLIFPVNAGVTRTMNIMGPGFDVAALSFATVTAGGTGGTTSPAGGDVKVTLIS